MDSKRFDDLTRTIGGVASRRATLLGLAIPALIAPLLGRSGEDATARKKHHHRKRRRKKKRKIKRNEFGCVDVGKFCKNADQCCSGICKGKKDKRKCKAHDTGSCRADQDACAEETPGCTTTVGDAGRCFRTTGNASYCAVAGIGAGKCFPCRIDLDCQQFCGLGAACIVCTGACAETEGRACVGQSECEFPDD